MIEKLDRVFNDYNIDIMLTEAFSVLAPFATPLILLGIYDILMYVGAFIGIVLIFRHRKRVVLSEGLLPPPKEGRVANVFMNAGTAAALGAFAVIFLLSLLP